MSDKTTEYAACHLLDGKIMGSRNKYLAEEGHGGRHRITREGDTVVVEELQDKRRVFEIPRLACVLERKPTEAKQEKAR